jgi:hypothetical protein
MLASYALWLQMHPQSPSFSRLASLARDLSGQGHKDKTSGRRTSKQNYLHSDTNGVIFICIA